MHISVHFQRQILTIGTLNGPILFAIAIDTDEYVSPIIAWTCAGFVQGSFEIEFSFPLISAIAILIPCAAKLHVS